MTTDHRFTFRLNKGCLRLDESPLLEGLPKTIAIEPDPQGLGAFLTYTAPQAADRHVIDLGALRNIQRFTACHRYEPFWMKACAGTRGGEVPIETQYLMAETTDGQVVLFVPLISATHCALLQGAGSDELQAVLESNDEQVTTSQMTFLYIAAGNDPYALVKSAAPRVLAHLQTGRLREEKPLPAFVDQFGWCTWDAYYQDVSHDKVREGLESFRVGGVQPRLLILDDGWQSERTMPSGERRLTAFVANDKFPGDLGPTVRMTKEEFGVQTFLVWNALNGYWGGVDGDAFPQYHVESMERQYSPGIRHYSPGLESEWWGKVVGEVAPNSIHRFFQDYYAHLRKQGVDGVKTDNQSAIEGLAHGFGGRVELMRVYHEALEGAAQTQLAGNLINCMSCSMEMLYGALNSSLTRTSTDFWPRRPETHGLHLYVNAQVSLWFSQFVHPDWDMFQSGHAQGAFHAAGRAVSGGPVYVSDKPDGHDFALLRKLVLPDGSVLRACQPGLPTRDCLFHDPMREDVLLKVFNLNPVTGVVGAFNAQAELLDPSQPTGLPEAKPITGWVSPADVDGLAGDRFVVFAHYAQEAREMARDERWELTLAPLASEVFTIAPLEQGVAALGLVDMFNAGGAVFSVETYPG